MSSNVRKYRSLQNQLLKLKSSGAPENSLVDVSKTIRDVWAQLTQNERTAVLLGTDVGYKVCASCGG